jgi:general secretion pathway protein E
MEKAAAMAQAEDQASYRPPGERTAVERDLAEALVEDGTLNSGDVQNALKIQENSDDGLIHILVQLGLLSESRAVQLLSDSLDIAIAQPEDFPAMAVLEGKVTRNFLRTARILPLREEDDHLIVAMADPLDDYAIDALRLAAGKPVGVMLATGAEISAAIDRLHRNVPATASSTDDGVTPVGDDDVEHLKDMASEAPVIRLVNTLVRNAVEARASDIHIEPFEDELRVRYRIDGLLREVEGPPKRMSAAVISRIKIMARLDIAERRLPQDGRIQLPSAGRTVDLRVATVPTMYGESVVIRILDRETVVHDFAALGFSDRLTAAYTEILERPHGMMLVSGTTGSGKTTTLYTSLLHLSTPEKKILTVEDPIEYHLDGVNQIQVQPRIGLEFASVLRSLLRQDPDIIMIGEIRDLETAQIAIQAALTGHIMLSTVHTHNASSAIARLLDMGVEDYLLSSTLNGVMSQRLVRRLCPHCKERYEPIAEMIASLGLEKFNIGGDEGLFRAKGCRECQGTGYSGRTVIAELLAIGEDIRRCILARAEASEIERTAIEQGMVTMFDYGIDVARAGDTSIEEILRVTREAAQ